MKLKQSYDTNSMLPKSNEGSAGPDIGYSKNTDRWGNSSLSDPYMPTILGTWHKKEPSQDEMATIKAELKAKGLLNPSYQGRTEMSPETFGGEGWVTNPNAKAPNSMTMDYQPNYIRDPNFGKVREFNAEQLASAGKVGGPSADQLAALSNTAMRSSIALRRGGRVGGLTRAIKGY